MVAKVKFQFTFTITIIIFLNLFSIHAKALEIIRDAELEQFTTEILSTLLMSENLETEDINVYFVNSNQVNAFVTGGKNIFINTEIIINSDDYTEYAAVIAHELAHIIGGHIFNTSIEISNLSDRALPIYLLGIIGIMSGSTETGLAGVMVGQASVVDGFTYYSRTQEASADQAAVNILCKNGINANALASFLNKLEVSNNTQTSSGQNYRSTHPIVSDRISWIQSSMKSSFDCDHIKDKSLTKRFQLLKAKIHGFTHPYTETEAIYNSTDETSLYATAVSNYFQGNHTQSINNLEILLKKYPSNPYYNELIGEIYYANHDYKKAEHYQLNAIKYNNDDNDLYYMMIGNYLLAIEDVEKIKSGIDYLKKSIQLNNKNAYSWYLLARAYAQIGEISLANYATAERYFLIGERSLSYDFALKALKNIDEQSPEWYRTSDLIEILKKEVSTIR